MASWYSRVIVFGGGGADRGRHKKNEKNEGPERGSQTDMGGERYQVSAMIRNLCGL